MTARNTKQIDLAAAAERMAAPQPALSEAEILAIKAEEAERARVDALEREAVLAEASSAAPMESEPQSAPKSAPPSAPAKPVEVAKPAPAKPAAPPFAVRGGRIRAPRRTVIYGPPGVGKTTLVADIQDALFFDMNNGSEALDVQRYQFRHDDPLRGHIPRKLDDIRAANKLLRTASHPYKCVVYEMLTDLEILCQRHILERDQPDKGQARQGQSLERYGFSAGKDVLLNEVRAILVELEALASKGIDVVIVAHAVTTKFSNPDGPDYDRYSFKCQPVIAEYLYGWAHEVGFLHFDDKAVTAGGKRGKPKGTSTGRRILEFDHSAAWDAKARLPFPRSIQVPSANPWQFYREALHRAYAMTANDLRAEIEAEIARIGDYVIPDGGKHAGKQWATVVRAEVAAVGDNKDRLTAFMQDLRRRDPVEKEDEPQQKTADDEI